MPDDNNDRRVQGPITHREKVERLIADLRGRGVNRYTTAPPLFRLLWRLGIDVPPPLFLGFIPLTLVAGSFFGVAWGALVWWWRRPAPPGTWLLISATTGLLFGLSMAAYYPWKAARLRLPRWESYVGVGPHDRKPMLAKELPPELRAKLDELKGSDYTKYVGNLQPLVEGKRVLRSEAGHSGFVLHLGNRSWVCAFLDGEVLRWLHGPEPMGPEVPSLIRSPHAADGAAPLGIDVPYATQRCDIAAEVAKSHAKPIKSLAIGESCFNFCFPDGRELDATIHRTPDGRPILRVFWEQW